MRPPAIAVSIFWGRVDVPQLMHDGHAMHEKFWPALPRTDQCSISLWKVKDALQGLDGWSDVGHWRDRRCAWVSLPLLEHTHAARHRNVSGRSRPCRFRQPIARAAAGWRWPL